MVCMTALDNVLIPHCFFKACLLEAEQKSGLYAAVQCVALHFEAPEPGANGVEAV